MFSQLFVAVYLALFAAAFPLTVLKSPVTIPLARRFNITGSKNILELDQARAKFLKSGVTQKSPSVASSAATFPIPATNGAVTYTAEVKVGSPATTFNLLVDTGSSNTWVGAGTPYTITSTSHDTGDEVFVEYGSGFVFGEEFIDQVSLAEGLIVPQQSIGVAEMSSGFEGVDGILGIGPTALTCGTTSNGGLVPTFLDNAFELGLLDSKEIGISFEPTTSVSITNGELTFGGIDSSKFTGDLHFVPLTTTVPASEFVGIDQTITYGTAGAPVLSQTSGILDTGTTLLRIASDALARYQTLTGAVLDQTTGLLSITPAQFENLQSLFFDIGSTTFEFTPNAQLWPRALNTAIGGTADSIYLVVADLGSESGSGLDFINGFVWLERFFFVFDAANSQAGFATTAFTDAIIN